MEYLGKKYYLFGDSFAEELLIKQVLLQAYDAIFHFDGIFPVNFGKLWKPKKYARKLQDDFMKNTFAEKMRIFSNYLKENPSGFMVGSRLSVADLAAYNLIANWYKVWDRGYFLKNFAHSDNYIKRIAAVPAVATYISTRQCPTVWLPNAWGAPCWASRTPHRASSMALFLRPAPSEKKLAHAWPRCGAIVQTSAMPAGGGGPHRLIASGFRACF